MKLSAVLLLLLSALALLVGSVALSPSEVLAALTGGGGETARFVVLSSRLPQMLTAILAGAALSAGGLVMQTVFANPLADPSLMGVSSGASLGAAVAILLFGGSWAVGAASLSGAVLTVVAAFIGAVAVIALIVFCSQRMRGTLALLVAGVMISFLISSIISLLSFYASADGVRSFVVWGLGDFSGVPLRLVPLLAVLVVVPLMVLAALGRPLNALLLGADYAENLGIGVRRVRTLSLLMAGVMTAAVTALCGPISFIGLCVPHVARLILRSADHRRLLPLSAVLGADAALLSLVIAHLPGERGTLPLAAITPLMGVPVVIYLLLNRR